MLTRNKKKRTSDKGKSRLENSKSSAASGNVAAEEVEEIVTVDHGGPSCGPDDECDCEKTDYFKVAWLLRQTLSGLVDGDKPGELLNPEARLRILLDMAVSLSIVSLDPDMLDPFLWRTLPKELLLHVWARLPVRDITRVRSLSTEWRTELATANSDINQVCHEASPTMIALVTQSVEDTFFVTLYDIKKCRWQCAYHLHLQKPRNADWEAWPNMWTAVDASDGGLVCFISVRQPTERDLLCIVVVNLFTRVQHELPPPHYQYSNMPAMVHIKVDSDTKCYQVFVVAYMKGRTTVEIYDSGTGQWTSAAPRGSIFGRVHNWTSGHNWWRKFSSTPGSYDLENGKLERYFAKDNPSTGKPVVDSVLEKDHFFLLQDETTQMGHPTAHRRRRFTTASVSYRIISKTRRRRLGCKGNHTNALLSLRKFYCLRNFPPCAFVHAMAFSW